MSEKSFTAELRVDEESLAITMGSGSLMVLATPAVIALMENAASTLADRLIDDEQMTTVGTMISVEHTSPTPVGASVKATAILTKTEGRKFYFDVFAEDEKGEIARGTHTRVSVNSKKFQQKADDKLYEQI